MSIELVREFPIPPFKQGAVHSARVVIVAGRLAAVDERYDNWASDAGVAVGSVKSQLEKDDLIAELDALVSLLYGLSEDQVEHIFATFHRGWAYQARLDSVMTQYAAWKGKV